MDAPQMRSPFACSMFQKKCTKTQHSGDQPFVMSQRALIALSGNQESAQAGVCYTPHRGRLEARTKQQS